MYTNIEVGLPLPMDVVGSLYKAIGALYPHARIVTKNTRGNLIFAISDDDRYLDLCDHDDEATSECAYCSGLDGVEADRAAEVEALLTSVEDGSFGVSGPEWFSKLLLSGLKQTLDSTTAENYLEMTLYDENNHRYAVVACRAVDRTPHELRKEADARAERYATKLRALGIDPDAD